LTANTVNGSGNGARSGAQTLRLLAAPLNVLLLQALAEGPKQQAELRREAGLPAQTTLRAQLKRLAEIGAIEKHRRNRFPGVLEYELTASGEELLSVAETLRCWLGMAEDGPLTLGGGAAKSVVKALAEGWSTTMLRILAARPLSLTELDRIIGSLSYPSLERRLAALRVARLVEPQSSDGRGTPYRATEWLRYGVAPLAAAARWERRRRPEITPPIGRLDVEAALLLAVPLLRLPPQLSGSCRLGAEVANGKPGLAGAMIRVKQGKVVACTTKLQGHPDAWALGSISAWLNALLEHDVDSLELGGDCRFVRSVVETLHDTLISVPAGHH
jgi:DNA-binding HxlR family transcriptional regulator